MKRVIIKTDKAPVAIGPYSQAIKSGNLVFVSGQIPIDPCSGNIFQGDIARQTELVLKNIEAILKAAGSSLAKVVKVNLYLKNLADLPKINEVYARFFSKNPPARACVEVTNLPREAELEIEVIADKG